MRCSLLVGLGGENISLQMDWRDATKFRAAGYDKLTINSSYSGGFVRQHNNVSFIRVFQAGHAVAAYQPEVVYRIFSRSIFGKDVATGTVSIYSNSTYSTSGPGSVWDIQQDLPDSPTATCYLWDIAGTCSAKQSHMIRTGTAAFEDYVLVSNLATATQPGSNDTTTTSVASGKSIDPTYLLAFLSTCILIAA
jgi:hypothetical protein